MQQSNKRPNATDTYDAKASIASWSHAECVKWVSRYPAYSNLLEEIQKADLPTAKEKILQHIFNESRIFF